MPDHESQPRSFVLLTGSTGLVGGLVLARLLECQIPVAVLVRGNRRQTATERIEAVMGRLEERFGKLFVRPVVLDGDLCQPGLGLSETDRRWIAANCGSVIHSAANLLFRPASEHPDNEPYRTNVDGTRHLLEVATAAKISEWHYVSTAYVAGLRDGKILEQECNVGQQFGNDYERSKVIAEDMVRTSPAIRSLTVYRPSIVIDLHPTTSMRSDQTINSAFVMFQTLSKQFGLPERGEWFRRLGFGGEERKNIVTVDWVAAMIAEIYRRPALHGSTYHLTSPTGTSASTLEDGFRAAVQSSSMKLSPRRAEATALIDEHAAPFVAAFKPYFKDDPKFDFCQF
jgi:thioester reductase-like protein